MGKKRVSTIRPGHGATVRLIDAVDVLIKANADVDTNASLGWIWSLEAYGAAYGMLNVSETLGVTGTDLGGTYTTMRFGKVADPVAPARTVYLTRSVESDPDVSSAPRVEMSGPFGGLSDTMVYGDTFWVSCGYCPVDFPTVSGVDEQIMVQVHGGGTNPGIALSIKTGGIQLIHRYNDIDPFNNANTQVTTYELASLTDRTWSYFEIKYKMGWQGGGLLYVYRDGVLAYSYSGKLGYDPTRGNQYVKFGQYHWRAGNVWTTADPRQLLLRLPCVIMDDTNKYTGADVDNYLRS